MRRQYTFNTGPVMYHLGINKAHPNVLSGGSPGRIRKLVLYLDAGAEVIESERGLVTVHGVYQGIPLTAFSTGMGPTSVAITLPEVIEACDADEMTIIRLGTAGGLQRYLKIGDFVATTTVDRAESTSDKIMGPNYEAAADAGVTGALVAAAQAVKHPYQSVYQDRTRTTDDVYFDAADSAQRLNKDLLAVSCEFSVYCALRDRYNRDQNRRIQVGELLVISDNLAAEHDAMDITQFQQRQREIDDAHIRAGLEALASLRK